MALNTHSVGKTMAILGSCAFGSRVIIGQGAFVMGVVTSDTGQCTVFVQGHLDGELLFHLPHARQKSGRRLDPVVEIA